MTLFTSITILLLFILGCICLVLLIKSAKRIGELKGEEEEKIEDLDKTRAELIQINEELKEEILKYKEILERQKPKDNSPHKDT